MLCIGDGALMMTLSDLDTATRYGLPLLVVVSNNFGLGAEYHHLVSRGYSGDQMRTRTAPSRTSLPALDSSPDDQDGPRARRCGPGVGCDPRSDVPGLSRDDRARRTGLEGDRAREVSHRVDGEPTSAESSPTMLAVAFRVPPTGDPSSITMVPDPSAASTATRPRLVISDSPMWSRSMTAPGSARSGWRGPGRRWSRAPVDGLEIGAMSPMLPEPHMPEPSDGRRAKVAQEVAEEVLGHDHVEAAADPSPGRGRRRRRR